MQMDVLAELEATGRPVVRGATGYVKLVCPFHDDKGPSLDVNLEHGGYRCWSCNASGPLHRLLATLKKTSEAIEESRLMRAYGSSRGISEKVIEENMLELWKPEHSSLVAQLLARGVDRTSALLYRLGAAKKAGDWRIYIPIQDRYLVTVSAKYYLPGAKERKFIGVSGRAKILQLYPWPQVTNYNTVFIVGGEIKAISAAARLNKFGIGACSPTGSETTDWLLEHSEEFRGKTVYLCSDDDPAGASSNKMRAQQLGAFPERIFICKYPWPGGRAVPKGGIDDYFALGGTVEDLLAAAIPYEPEKWREELSEEAAPISVTLSGAYQPSLLGKPLLIKAQFAGAEDVPRTIPSGWNVTCSKSEKELCSFCAVGLSSMSPYFKNVSPQSDFYLRAMKGTKKALHEEIKVETGIPARCGAHKITPMDHVAITEVRLADPFDLTTASTLGGKQAQPGLVVQSNYEDVDMLSPHIVSCRAFTDPTSQYVTLVSDHAEKATDGLDRWTLGPADSDALKAYGASGSVAERLAKIVTSVELDITGIYNRKFMHLCMLLTYCSPLYLKYGNRTQRGWMESLIVGDSSNGKSQARAAILEAVRLGEVVDCKTASRAGLLGGNIKLDDSGKLFMKWGALPRMDRMLLWLEELKGLDPEIIGKMTEARSSGVLEIALATHRRAPCRTRLICLSNPRSNRRLATYPFGVTALLELIGAPEDLRRFDLCCVVPDSTQSRIPPRGVTTIPDIAQLLRTLILRAWTIDAEDISYGFDLHKLESMGDSLRKSYSSEIPVIDPGSTSLKLLRVATSAALLSGSLEEDEGLRVTDEHLDWSDAFIREMYDSDDLGYATYSRAHRTVSKFSEANMRVILGAISVVDFADDLLEHMRSSEYLNMTDIMHFGGCQETVASEIIGELRRLKCLRVTRSGNQGSQSYTKTQAFQNMLSMPAEELDKLRAKQ